MEDNANFSNFLIPFFSFDKTVKIWSVETGECLYTLTGHTGEVVSVQFNPQGTLLASGSMDTTAKLWSVSSGLEIASLNDHCGEIISLSFNQQVFF